MHQGLQHLEHHEIWPNTSSFHSFFTTKPQPMVTPSTHVSLKVNNTINIHRPVANESICKNCQKYTCMYYYLKAMACLLDLLPIKAYVKVVKNILLQFEGNSLFVRPVQYHISIACSIYYHTSACKIYHRKAVATCAPTTTALCLD